jgi:hypothetical protein
VCPCPFRDFNGFTISFLILVSIISRGIGQFLVSPPPKGWTQSRETIWQGTLVFHFIFAHACRLCLLRDTRFHLLYARHPTQNSATSVFITLHPFDFLFYFRFYATTIPRRLCMHIRFTHHAIPLSSSYFRNDPELGLHRLIRMCTPSIQRWVTLCNFSGVCIVDYLLGHNPYVVKASECVTSMLNLHLTYDLLKVMNCMFKLGVFMTLPPSPAFQLRSPLLYDAVPTPSTLRPPSAGNQNQGTSGL